MAELSSPIQELSAPIQNDAPSKGSQIVRPLWLIAPFAAISIIVAFLSKSHFTWPDETDYYNLASNLVHIHTYSSNGISPTAFRPPGYAFFLATMLHISSNIAFLHYANFCLWLGSAYLTYQISQMLYGKVAGIISLVWVLAYPVSLYLSMFLYPQIMASVLFLSSLYVHLKISNWGTGWRVLEGLLFGILILTISMYLFVLPCLVVLVAAQSEKPWRALGILMLGIALPLGIWTIRNYSIFHRFTFIATQGGHELLVGNSPNTTANSGVNADINTYIDEAKRMKLDEVQTDLFYRRSAVDWIMHHPRNWLLLYGEKLLNWFNFRNDLATSDQGSTIKWVIAFFTWYSLLTVALLHIWVKADRWTAVDFYLWGAYASGALSYAIFFTRVRYRLPFDYILIIQAAACVAELLKRRGLIGIAGERATRAGSSLAAVTESELCHG